MNYEEATAYLDSFVNYEKLGGYSVKALFKLDRMKRLLASLGNPHRDFISIHVAGTKGKGSTCAFLYSILKRSGKKVGLYTSPHLVDFRERIRIAKSVKRKVKSEKRKTKNEDELISKESVRELLEEIKPYANRMRTGPKLGELSFFEVYTALAFLHFAREKVNCAVIETGLGGRLDATNVVDGEFAIITPISYDHTQQLGRSIRSIAQEKAGIIKENGCVVSSKQVKAAWPAIKNACRKRNAKLYSIGREIAYERALPSIGGEAFNLKVEDTRYENLRIGLLGAHQVENAAAAAAMAQLFGAADEAIRDGLRYAAWPGRLQVISKEPLVILDGAQNAASARALRVTLEELFPKKKFTLIFGVSFDKDVRGIAKELFPIVDEVILTKADSPRAFRPQALSACLKDLLPKNYSVKENVAQAIDCARARANAQAILVTGSLYVVGEALEYFRYE